MKKNNCLNYLKKKRRERQMKMHKAEGQEVVNVGKNVDIDKHENSNAMLLV